MVESNIFEKLKRTGWRTSITPYLKWSMAAMLVLGFASGLPLMMVFSKLSFWLREVGIERSTIGGLYAVSFAYSLKFLWAPVVDGVHLPILSGLGQRRSWMALAICGTILGLSLIGLSDPATALRLTVIGALILAFSGATLDIAVDAWRIESAPDDEQANMAAVYILGYRLAIMFAGFSMVLAGYSSFNLAYLVMAIAMAVILTIVIFVIKEPSQEHLIPKEYAATASYLSHIRRIIFEPFWQFLARYGVWLIAISGIVTLYRISDFTMGVMASPFYADLGYSAQTVGWIQGIFGPWPIVLGGFLGGFIAVKFRLLPALLWGAGLTLLTNGAFAALALAAGPGLDAAANGVQGALVNTPNKWALLGVILADNLAAGYVGAVFIAYLSSLVDRQFAATQYALLSSAYSFFCKLVATATSGPLAETVGWAQFFLITALYTIPPALIILYLMHYGPDWLTGKSTPPLENDSQAKTAKA